MIYSYDVLRTVNRRLRQYVKCIMHLVSCVDPDDEIYKYTCIVEMHLTLFLPSLVLYIIKINLKGRDCQPIDNWQPFMHEAVPL